MLTNLQPWPVETSPNSEDQGSWEKGARAFLDRSSDFLIAVFERETHPEKKQTEAEVPLGSWAKLAQTELPGPKETGTINLEPEIR